MQILVVYASADGSTADIAHRIVQVLSERGHDVLCETPDSTGHLDGIDAVVLGSAVHSRQWLDEASDFVNAHRQALHNVPFWTFSVGMPDALPKAFRRLARTEEGAIVNQLGELQPRGHRLFSGVLKSSQFPLATRIFLRLARVRYGDYRDWPAIDAWASEIADEIEVRHGQAAQGSSAEQPVGPDSSPAVTGKS
jgi:menaquinone-dependent protoporphyrinogen oxidase